MKQKFKWAIILQSIYAMHAKKNISTLTFGEKVNLSFSFSGPEFWKTQLL